MSRSSGAKASYAAGAPIQSASGQREVNTYAIEVRTRTDIWARLHGHNATRLGSTKARGDAGALESFRGGAEHQAECALSVRGRLTAREPIDRRGVAWWLPGCREDGGARYGSASRGADGAKRQR